MHVKDILKTKGTNEVISVRSNDRVRAAAERLHQKRIGAVLVLDDQSQIVGILSERDIVDGLAEHGERVLTMPVDELMSPRVYTCSPSDSIKEVMTWMTRHRVRHLPVVEEGELRGLISIGDVVKHRLDDVRTEANVLRDIIIASR